MHRFEVDDVKHRGGPKETVVVYTGAVPTVKPDWQVAYLDICLFYVYGCVHVSNENNLQ